MDKITHNASVIDEKQTHKMAPWLKKQQEQRKTMLEKK